MDIKRDDIERILAECERRLHELKGEGTGDVPDIRVVIEELERNRELLLTLIEDQDGARRQAEQARREWIAAFDAIGDPIFMHDREFRVLRANRAYAERAGMKFRDIIGRPYWEVFPRRDGPLPGCLDALHRGVGQEEELTLESGEILISRAFPILDADGVYLSSVHTLLDITARRRAEQELHTLNHMLRTISACNEQLVRANDEDQLLQAMCRVIIETGGFRLAWVGYREHDAAQSVRPVARAGHDGGYVDALNITWADRERGRGPVGSAIRSGAIQMLQTIHEPNFKPWHDQARQRGYASVISLPLMDNGEAFGALSIYAERADAFNADEAKLLHELAADLTFGIMTLRNRAARAHAEVRAMEGITRLGKAMEQTVQAVALTVEKRDPCTAGHQLRVAHLAVEIARLLGLPEDRIQGLYLGGLIHDIGKICVPAEILNRAGRISAAEFMIIKTHPQVGYDIIKGVEFPWPVAQMILQHHERLDGSGYPQGLKNGAIMIEARILAVADVVEAMASHRPYRPELGMERALAEVEAQRGILFDPEVVDACLRLFREQGYSLVTPAGV